MLPRLSSGGLLRAPRSTPLRSSAAAAEGSSAAEEGRSPEPPCPRTPAQATAPGAVPRSPEHRGRRHAGLGGHSTPALLHRAGRMLHRARTRGRAWSRRPSAVMLALLLASLLMCMRAILAGRRAHRGGGPVVWPRREPSHRASLKPLMVLNQSADSCAQALGIPKVALLFLSRGKLPHELTWRKWFRAAAGQLPISAVVASGACGRAATALERLREACGQGAEGNSAAGILACQHLFSVYVHTPPGFQGFPPDSLWGREGIHIEEHVNTTWGTHTLVEAARALIWAAASDPANQRFLLLSETDIPLYDPLTFYQQLISEDRSRINACLPANRNATWHKTSLWRWIPPMKFNSTYWRKSSQWFTLIRPHAEAVLQDVDIFRAFEEHCWSGWVPEVNKYRDCYSDEHYLPTLLAVRGLEGECACEAWSGPAYMDWSGGGPHPRTFSPQDVSTALVMAARGEGNWQGCQAREALESSPALFVRYHDLVGMDRDPVCTRLASTPLPAPYSSLNSTCALTARKFPANTSLAVHALFTGCEGAALGLLGRGMDGSRSALLGCAQQQRQQQQQQQQQQALDIS